MKKQLIFILPLIFLFFSCSSKSVLVNHSIDSGELNCIIKLDKENIKNLSEFSLNTLSDSSLSMRNGKMITGYRTQNNKFLDEVIKPAVEPYKFQLTPLSKREIVNQLTIFAFQAYQQVFGKGFYRWGGDILDLDDPQYESIRHKFKYGLDCSGMSVVGYELAAYLNLVKGEELLYSSPGFRYYCETTGFKDGGALDSGSNNFRLDTKELDQLGALIVRIEKGGEITEEKVKSLRAGDIVGRDGHFGVIVESKSKLYYLESGGWVVPEIGGRPVEILHAINKFAENGYVSVRRCIND
ncbi:MAG: hypothetical protein AB9882_11680 [Ignavibacteriaceae bacterium]